MDKDTCGLVHTCLIQGDVIVREISLPMLFHRLLGLQATSPVLILGTIDMGKPRIDVYGEILTLATTGLCDSLSVRLLQEPITRTISNPLYDLHFSQEVAFDVEDPRGNKHLYRTFYLHCRQCAVPYFVAPQHPTLNFLEYAAGFYEMVEDLGAETGWFTGGCPSLFRPCRDCSS
ncbi:hypothetical protein [Pasteuria penetrans]|uniref:hypothetical protein n=1 Tax=Pasteuria penetrans TaxID=86005 RepID=UPI000F9406F6|nr:hypothetical protein [Pasteuria penetrans]